MNKGRWICFPFTTGCDDVPNQYVESWRRHDSPKTGLNCGHCRCLLWDSMKLQRPHDLERSLKLDPFPGKEALLSTQMPRADSMIQLGSYGSQELKSLSPTQSSSHNSLPRHHYTSQLQPQDMIKRFLSGNASKYWKLASGPQKSGHQWSLGVEERW